MKCFLTSVLGLDQLKQQKNDVCVEVPPIVRSLIGSTAFLVFMVILSHALKS